MATKIEQLKAELKTKDRLVQKLLENDETDEPKYHGQVDKEMQHDGSKSNANFVLKLRQELELA